MSVRHFLAILLLVISSRVGAQVTINTYAAVLGKSSLPCTNTFIVDTATGFTAGDTIIVIQMKGAKVDTSNTSTFGAVLTYGGAGNYEYNVISAVSGNNITLRLQLFHTYDMATGRVQFVKVPSYTAYTVGQPHTCRPWTGDKGGVFAIRVAGALTLNSSINVTGKGFRGGQPLYSTASGCNKQDYYYSSMYNDAAQKGEGIATISDAKMWGRGPLANGGGGGNDHNGGGGGGGNISAGGRGGDQFYVGPCATAAAIGGIGGIALSAGAGARLFLGGGGGCGHGNNLAEEPGAVGGGIIIISAGSIVGNSQKISANGYDAEECTGAAPGCEDDGGGGGGGGGSVFFNVPVISGTLTIDAKGGKGSNIYVSYQTKTPVAPGGGGSGGVIALTSGSSTSSVFQNVGGGQPGIVPQYGNTNHGAQPGSSGQKVSANTIPAGPVYSPVTADFTESAVSCFTRNFVNRSTGSTGLTYSWTFGTTASSLISPVISFPGYGTYPVTLVVRDVNGCTATISKIVDIPYVHFARGVDDTATCYGKPVYLNAYGGMSYAWSPVKGLADPDRAYTRADPQETTTFIVTVTDSRGCTDDDTVIVTVVPSPNPVDAGPADVISCVGKTVQLHASGSTSYQWVPVTGLNNPNSSNPVATVKGAVTYAVLGRDAAGCVSTDTVSISIKPGPEVKASSFGTANTCQGTVVELKATGTAVKYEWYPAAYVQHSGNGSVVKALPPKSMIFTVTGYDAEGCTTTDSVQANAMSDLSVFMPDAFSPNGDGLNDGIRPIVRCDFTLDEYRVYNRWGQLVYSTGEITQPWMGNYKGLPADIGEYHYILLGRRPSNDKPVMYKGNFALIR